MKRGKKAALIIIPLVICLAAAGAYIYYTGTIGYKLAKLGYTKDQAGSITAIFSEEEQQVLLASPATPEIIDIASDPRYQKANFKDYLSGLQEGKTAETLLTDYDPRVVKLRAEKGYLEQNLAAYLSKKDSVPDMADQDVVRLVNTTLVYEKTEGYDPALYDKYEAYRLKQVQKTEGADPDVIDEALCAAVVKHVNTALPYSSEKYYIDAYLDRYEAYRAANPDKALTDVVAEVNAGIDKPFYTDIEHADMSKGYLVLVNKYYYVEDSDKPQTTALSGYGVGELESTAAEAFKQMVEAARAEGLSLRAVSPYRTWAIQNLFYTGYARNAGTAEADTYSARPGHSEHQTGLAVDINVASISAHFENTAEYAWLQNNCWKYGFILRYLPDKQYLTGYVYEPWHYRYVGTEYAKDIMDSGITFEEWYAFYVANPDK